MTLTTIDVRIVGHLLKTNTTLDHTNLDTDCVGSATELVATPVTSHPTSKMQSVTIPASRKSKYSLQRTPSSNRNRATKKHEILLRVFSARRPPPHRIVHFKDCPTVFVFFAKLGEALSEEIAEYCSAVV